MQRHHIILILDNVRSGHNVGSIFRTADAAGVEEIFLCGITPYPALPNDSRPRHVITSNLKEIRKTALGAEATIPFRHYDSTLEAMAVARSRGYKLYCIENNVPNTVNINHVVPSDQYALILGSETTGSPPEVIEHSDATLEIPMHGSKHSLNVSVATGVALYLLDRADTL